ncbi:differentially expressed in FDCP 8 homolog [Toxorhynchites rutilus septentrionalis]|uniref:differentially expressed in FDCP 8 homolog n=1 Tax=Toxorhynchites rutilus septentrionalis TaxID=329112 RepID=UPI002479956C|nr:differentially expressed in FDCP 8 homolog [Toxorhynchites rutilus septentrionalis]
MQTVQNLTDGILGLPHIVVNSLLGRGDATSGDYLSEADAPDNNNNPEAEGVTSGDTDSNIDDDITHNNNGESISIDEATVAEDDAISPTRHCIPDRSHAIPYALITEQWQLVLDQECTIPEIENSILKCKDLVLGCAEDTEDRKWLVRHLIELRYRLRELQDVENDLDGSLPGTKVILGHHFIARKNCPRYKVYCDHCSGIIWNVVQASYVCIDCSFAVHHKCIRNVIRICAHVISAEQNLPVECICPEIGLAFQKYTCAECGSQLNCDLSTAVSCFGLEFKAEKFNSIEPRLCDYSGLYYCPACHWNDTSVVPARVINNWDFVPRKVGRASLQQIRLLYDRPVIKLEEKNPRLFQLVRKLGGVKRLRQKLTQMRRYLTVCRIADELRLMRDSMGTRRHLIQTIDMYSVADCVGVENGTLPEFLQRMHDTFDKHIRSCLICSGKAYICEVCNNNEVIFPFDDSAISCERCNSVTHRACHFRKNMQCLKCARLRIRKQQLRNEILDAANGN